MMLLKKCAAHQLFIEWISQQHTTLHTITGLLLKLCRVVPGQSLDGRQDAAGRGAGGPVGNTLFSGLKSIPKPQGSDWGHCPV